MISRKTVFDNFLKKPVVQIVILIIFILWTAVMAGFFVFDKTGNIFHINLLKKSASNLPHGTGQMYADYDTDKHGSFNTTPRRIDGILVPEEEANLYPVAIMIENMVDSRPSSGLSKANLVYEAIAEAGITRFLAIYAGPFVVEDVSSSASPEAPAHGQTQNPPARAGGLAITMPASPGALDLASPGALAPGFKIGPIRSTRPYFLDWAEEFRALYLHVGGSPDALKEIPLRQIFDLNQYFNGKYFWREKTRPAPHNVYTSSELLGEALVDKKIPLEGNYQSWLFKDETPTCSDQIHLNSTSQLAEGLNVKCQMSNVKVDFSTPSYQVEWQYQPSTNDYLRFQAGALHVETDGSKIRAKNIVVQVVETKILDEAGRRQMKTIGQGKAFIFQDGQIIEGKWVKNRPGCPGKYPGKCLLKTSRTRFYDQSDVEIKFNRGTTWIEIIPNPTLLHFY